MADCRYVVDESAFTFGSTEWNAVSRDLRALADQLLALREAEQTVGLVSGWGAIECLTGVDLATVLSAPVHPDRDLRLRLLGLLDKCQAWDESPGVVIHPLVTINGVSTQSFGIAWAHASVASRRGMAAVTMPHTQCRGSCRVGCCGVVVAIHFVVSSADHAPFHRSLYELEDVAESDFWSVARLAFPELVFAEALTFRRFAGPYVHLRSAVVLHLGALNDRFLDAFHGERGDSRRVSARLGIDVSREGATRASESLMRLRDVQHGNLTYRCEWHTKLEPNRNRIHFHPGDAGTQGRVFIGVFVDHLPT